MPDTSPQGLTRLAFGGDYNPEQWPESVWQEDVRLMREAGVTMVSVGIFSWALLEPARGQYDFGWLDRIIGLLHDNGIRVDLGTPTVVPPVWFYREHPEALPVAADGTRYAFGSRGAICHSSAVYRAAAANITTRLAERYADHPALAMWHVHNEYGVPVSACYCDSCAAHFRRWLETTYGGIEAVNAAWGTAFWGQRYASFEDITPPRTAPTVGNPGQALDFKRFADATMRENFTAERDILHRLAPGVPVTTNFMTALSQCDSVDYWAWGREVDIVTNDHYLITDGRRTHVNLAMAADLTRSVGGGAPWILLEHSTSGINWQPRNPAKAPGEMARNSLAHVARGSEGAMFFQWRQSRRGAEKFHSAMVPHGGTDTRVWREVVELGASLDALNPIRGSRTEADVAVLWDWQSWWAQNLAWRPSEDADPRERADAFYEALYDRHLTVDFAHPESDLSTYPLVVVPALYLMTEAAGNNLRAYVAGGGTLVVSFFSGIVDEHDAVHDGAYPGALRDVLGLTVEEFSPLLAGETVRLTGADGAELTGDVWSEFVVPRGAETVWSFADGLAAGRPAVTRHRLGEGTAWYVSTRLGAEGLDTVLARAADDAGITPRDLPRDVEVVRRSGENADYLFAINHTAGDVKVPLESAGTELLTGDPASGHLAVPAGAVRVVRLDG
ncbi:beta-galactosidase [Streptomyces acidiscabies]|uniref:Beta-galactosidase n=6 Tax=Bacteria TaxID=2 RepID=A0AAP6BAZ8_9ACTN|nr:beta-galactosidase [Streptomyces acidiscabies]MBP5935092.1 beta-galactosidase [Streptomyces sp. LBUM 1476]MBZ3917119.1 beta-galactosidase [Streptomyces acidiscabies]MDX2961359.1 beta-galactosidase [Streptomyces acidiscabies]MDX3022717.1 beta-galactosidase [Streptomyces acidiscabies]MDX3792081.1 beta-galactosidase [Streptomyces acidiscabies]